MLPLSQKIAGNPLILISTVLIFLARGSYISGASSKLRSVLWVSTLLSLALS
jgi:hypothetical protein